jgi:hypothetical protein
VRGLVTGRGDSATVVTVVIVVTVSLLVVTVVIVVTVEAMKKCTPYSLLEQILVLDKHKMTRSRLSSGENLHYSGDSGDSGDNGDNGDSGDNGDNDDNGDNIFLDYRRRYHGTLKDVFRMASVRLKSSSDESDGPPVVQMSWLFVKNLSMFVMS